MSVFRQLRQRELSATPHPHIISKASADDGDVLMLVSELPTITASSPLNRAYVHTSKHARLLRLSYAVDDFAIITCSDPDAYLEFIGRSNTFCVGTSTFYIPLALIRDTFTVIYQPNPGVMTVELWRITDKNLFDAFRRLASCIGVYQQPIDGEPIVSYCADVPGVIPLDQHIQWRDPPPTTVAAIDTTTADVELLRRVGLLMSRRDTANIMTEHALITVHHNTKDDCV